MGSLILIKVIPKANRLLWMKIRMGLDEIIHFEIIQNCKSLDSVIISGCENERLLVTKNLDNNLHNWAQIFSELYLNIKKGVFHRVPSWFSFTVSDLLWGLLQWGLSFPVINWHLSQTWARVFSRNYPTFYRHCHIKMVLEGQ